MPLFTFIVADSSVSKETVIFTLQRCGHCSTCMGLRGTLDSRLAQKLQCGRGLVISTHKVKEGGAPADKENTPRDGLQSICSGNPVVGLLLNQ